MNYEITQLNFLYLYKLCIEKSFDVSVYEDDRVEDISKDDISCLINFILARENISISYSDCNFGDDIENLLAKSDIENLAKIGAYNFSHVKVLKTFKENTKSLFENLSSPKFINIFDRCLSIKGDVLNALKELRTISKEKDNKKKDKDDKKKAINILF